MGGTRLFLFLVKRSRFEKTTLCNVAENNDDAVTSQKRRKILSLFSFLSSSLSLFLNSRSQKREREREMFSPSQKEKTMKRKECVEEKQRKRLGQNKEGG